MVFRGVGGCQPCYKSCVPQVKIDRLKKKKIKSYISRNTRHFWVVGVKRNFVDCFKLEKEKEKEKSRNAKHMSRDNYKHQSYLAFKKIRKGIIDENENTTRQV